MINISADAFSAHYPGANFDAEWQQLVFPDEYKNPQPIDNYNLVVIGGGTAGLITAIASAGLGAKVALVERHAMGGDCLNVGCVPSKAILAASKQLGAQTDSFAQAMAWLRKVRADISHHDSVERYNESGVDVYLGEAAFNVDGKVQVKGENGERELKASKYVIASGSRAVLPPIPGLDTVQAHTNHTIFDLKQQPEHLLIIGAGAIGCELAQAFCRLGSKVSLLDMADRVLPLEEVEASAVLQKALLETGVDLHLGVGIEKVSQSGQQINIHIQGKDVLIGDTLLVAAGRAPNASELNLEAVGVEYDRHGVKVDDKLCTTNKKIFAAGDICAEKILTHNADTQARIVIANALFVPTGKVSAWTIPHCTYTEPEVAHLGITRAEADKESISYDVWRIDWADMDRAKAEGNTDGFVEVLTKKATDKIVGATIVGPHAGDLLAPLVIMHANGLGLSAAGKAVLPYPSRGEYLKRLADQYSKTKLTPFVANLFKRWLTFRR